MTGRLFRRAALIGVVLVVAGCSPAWIARVNVGSDGAQVDQPSFAGGAISADGRFVAFESFASTLVPNDTNGATDVFVRDNLTGTTERVSVASDESQADEPVGAGAGRELGISPDGRFVVFHASFNDLVAEDTSGNDVFVRDRLTGTTERVNLADDESQANKDSFAGDISADGRYVSFSSAASNLVPGDTNGDPPCSIEDPLCDAKGSDVFVRDRVAGTTERVSVTDDDTEANSESRHVGMSDDGQYVAFTSVATNVVPADTSDNDDIFVRDRVDGVTELVSVAIDGTSGNGSSFSGDMSPDGRFVTFMSTADDLVTGDPGDPFAKRHIYARDRVGATTERVDVSTGGTFGNREPDPESAVSADGRYVVFASFADDLVDGDTNGATDIFMRDRELGTLERVSLTYLGLQAADASPPPAGPFSTSPELSDDGRYVVFSSQADNLVVGDTNGLVTDVFTRFVPAPIVESASPSSIGPGTTQVTVTGARFLSGVTVAVTGDGVTVGTVARVDETTLLVDITVAGGAMPGPRALRVGNSGTGAGSSAGGYDLCACLSVS